MSRSRVLMLFMITLACSLALGCGNRSRGGGNSGRGGSGGGGDDVSGDDDDAVGGDDDDAAGGVGSGYGRNVGSTSMGANVGVGAGDTTLYVVNLGPSSVGQIGGRTCDEIVSFEADLAIEQDEYGVLEGLEGDCWYFEAYGEDDYFDYSVEDMDGEWTWVIGSDDAE